MSQLYSQYASGTQFTAGGIVGSYDGVSGINPLVDKINILAPYGENMNTGNLLVPSGISTLVGSADTDRKTLLIYNYGGSGAIYVGVNGVTPITGFEIGANDFYEYRDTEVIYATTDTSGGAAGGGKDLRYLEVTYT